jgi:hypothetical protein
MDDKSLAEMVFYQLDIFYFVDFVEGLAEKGDRRARQLLDEFASKRHPKVTTNEFLPLLRATSTIAMLFVPFHLAVSAARKRRSGVGFTLAPSHDLVLLRNGEEKNESSVQDVLSTIRNAVAHYQTNVEFPPDRHVTFKSCRREEDREIVDKVVFRTPDGFHQFILDLLPFVWREAGKVFGKHE